MNSLETRINAIYSAPDAAYAGGIEVSTASKGNQGSNLLIPCFLMHFRRTTGFQVAT